MQLLVECVLSVSLCWVCLFCFQQCLAVDKAFVTWMVHSMSCFLDLCRQAVGTGCFWPAQKQGVGIVICRPWVSMSSQPGFPNRSLHARLSPGFDIVREEPPTPLPEGVVPLSPIVDLFPHNTAFGGQRVVVVLPTCSGADKAWRSLPEGGWEELTEVEFFGGHAALRLDHFCKTFLGTQSPQPRRLKVRGFLSRTQRAAKCALVHSLCDGCEEQLRQTCCQDPDELAGFDECSPPKLAGLYEHGEELVLSHGKEDQEWSQRVKLLFNRFPLVTSTTISVQEPRFDVSIDDQPHTFCAPARAE